MSGVASSAASSTQGSSIGGVSIKRRKPAAFQEKRRKSFLERQQTLRRDSVDVFRNLVADDNKDGDIKVNSPREVICEELAESVMDIELAVDEKRAVKPKRSSTSKYRDVLMIPEYFIDIPSDFGTGMDVGQGGDSQWLVTNRPCGVRCLVISAQGTTISRGEDGRVIERFKSLLPGGSAASTPGTPEWAARGGSNESSKNMYAVLDCIFCPMTITYYILDLLNWKDYPLQECTAEFRVFWLASKFSDECPPEVGTRAPHNDRSMIPLRFTPVSHDSISSLYHSSHSPYISDGLIFYHNNGHYVNGLSPLVLLWQDEKLLSNTGVYPHHTLEAALELKSWFAGKISPNEYDVEAKSGVCDPCTSDNCFGLFTAEGYLVHQFLDGIPTQLDAATSDSRVQNGDIVKCTYDRISDGGAINGSCFVNFEVCSKVGTCDSCSRSSVDSWSQLLYFNAMKSGDSYSNIDYIISVAAAPPTAMIADDFIR